MTSTVVFVQTMENPLEVKFSCCLKWLLGILKSKSPDTKRWQSIIDESTKHNKVSVELIQLLTHPFLYYVVYTSIVDKSEIKLANSSGSFWPLIQSLVHQSPLSQYNSIAESRINHSILVCTSPLNQFAHCVLIECIMNIYSSLLAPIGKVVKSIRKVSVLYASKELPSTVEEGLLLWINKIGRVALNNEQQLHQKMIRESDAIVRRNYRLKVLREGGMVKGFPRAVNLTSSLSDGQCLAAVLMYYAGDKLNWSDFYFSHDCLGPKKALSNLKKIKSFCDTHLPCPSLHIDPEIWVEHISSESSAGFYSSNVTAFLAFLFNHFDSHFLSITIPQPKFSEDINPSVSSSITTSTPVKAEPMKRKNTLPLCSSSQPPPLLNISSISDTAACITKKDTVQETMSSEAQLLRLRIARGSHSLSTSALSNTSGTRLSCSKTLFPGVMRDPLLPIQNSLLNSFQNAPKELITPSIESLGIQSQINSVLAQKASLVNRLEAKEQNINEQSAEKLGSEASDDGSSKASHEVIKLKFVRPPSTVSADHDKEETVIDIDQLHEHDKTVKPHEDRERETEKELVKEMAENRNYSTSDDLRDQPIYLHVVDDMGTVKEPTDINVLMLKSQIQQNVKKMKEKMRAEQLEQMKFVNEKVFFDLLVLSSQEKPPTNNVPAATAVSKELTRPASSKGSGNNTTRPPSKKGSRNITRPPSTKETVRPPSTKGSRNNTRPSSGKNSEKELKDETRRRRREEQVKMRLEEREKERKNLIEERKKERKSLIEERKKERKGLIEERKKKNPIQQKESLALTHTITHHGKSNYKLIKNALCYVCLAGEANISMKQIALNELENSSAGHFMILFRDNIGLKFKGLYGYTIDQSYMKLFGTGPKSITENMIAKLYKYNSGTKSFQAIPSHTFSLSVDAFTIQDHFWTNRRKTVSGVLSTKGTL